jgi:hypothetical protein
MHHADTKRWVDQLSSVVVAKNSRKLRALGDRAPEEVTFENQHEVFEALYGKESDLPMGEALELGTRVQLALDVMPFHKSFSGYFGSKVYKIGRVHFYPPNTRRYTIIDEEDNVAISGTYYKEELYPL